jgi:hypothetical protein
MGNPPGALLAPHTVKHRKGGEVLRQARPKSAKMGENPYNIKRSLTRGTLIITGYFFSILAAKDQRHA